MISSGSYQGCRVFIYDKNGNNVGCTKVIRHDKYYGTIVVERKFMDIKNVTSVTVLIVTDNDAHEYQGNLRKSMADSKTMEIALFKGQVKKRRAATRYPINKEALVHNLIVKNKLIPLLNPIVVFIYNLSATGVLLRANPFCFALNTTIEIKLTIDSNVTTIYCKVVRIKNIDRTAVEYGCKFVSLS